MTLPSLLALPLCLFQHDWRDGGNRRIRGNWMIGGTVTCARCGKSRG